MAWVKVDDGYADHKKHVKVGPLGQALWLAGLAYCNRNLTDGFIPWGKARSLCSWEFLGEPDDKGRTAVYQVSVSCGMRGEDVTSEFVINLLVQAELWEVVDGGYQVHDYDKYQPSREDVLAEREATAIRQARFRGARAGHPTTGNGVSNGVTPTVSNGVSNGVSSTVINGRVTPAPDPDPVHASHACPPTPHEPARQPASPPGLSAGLQAYLEALPPEDRIAAEAAVLKLRQAGSTCEEVLYALRECVSAAERGEKVRSVRAFCSDAIERLRSGEGSMRRRRGNGAPPPAEPPHDEYAVLNAIKAREAERDRLFAEERAQQESAGDG